MELKKIIGLNIVAIKGIRTDRRKKKGFSPQFILFDDEQTFIELEDQDYYTYHDCDSSAKTITLRQEEVMWKRINEETDWFPDADTDIRY